MDFVVETISSDSFYYNLLLGTPKVLGNHLIYIYFNIEVDNK